MKKLTFNKLAFKSIKAGKRKYLTLTLSIFFAMTFLIGGLFFISCMNSSTRELGYQMRGEQSDVILNAGGADFENPSYSKVFDGKVGIVSVLSLDFMPDDEKEQSGVAVARLDERAQELYHQKPLQGRLPEKEGEIALENNALVRLKLDVEIGDRITFKEKAANNDRFTDKTTERTYTLVGILKDRKTYFEHQLAETTDRNSEFSIMLPSAFVYRSQKIAAGGKEFLIALYKQNESIEVYRDGYYNSFFDNVIGENHNRDTFSTGQYPGTFVGSDRNTVETKSQIGIVLCFVLAFMSCFSIANSFTRNLKDRKKLIGMLRAIGATKRQTVSLFMKEAVLLCAVLLPLSVLVSYFGVKLFSVVMGENFIFMPNPWVILIGVVLSLLCVILSTLVPLVGISRLSPMQAVRDIELMRKVKNKKIKSQKSFRTSSLLAKRAITFSKGRFAGVVLILTATTVVVCTCVTSAFDTAQKENWMNSSYLVMGTTYFNTFANGATEKYDLTQQKLRQCQALPYVERVEGNKIVCANLFIDGEENDYLKLMELDSPNGEKYDHNDLYNPEVKVEVTEDNFEEVMYGEISSDYTEIKNKAGYDCEFVSVNVEAATRETLESYKKYVTDGKIDINKINAGEEIIVNAPEEMGYFYKRIKSRSWYEGTVNLCIDKSSKEYEREGMKYLVKMAKNCFKAGDYVTLSVLVDDNGKLTRKDKTFKIGAVIDRKVNYDFGKFYTTNEGLNTYGLDFAYDGINIYLDRDCDAEIDEQMQSNLAAVFPGNTIDSKYIEKEMLEATLQNTLLTLFSIVAVFICVCITLINNTVTAQIGENKRTIGTLRAVGTDEKELSRSYLLQILQSVGIGFVSGSVLYTIGYTVLKVVFYKNEPVSFALWAAVPAALITLAVCLINLKIRVKRVSKYSIVENIREL